MNTYAPSVSDIKRGQSIPHSTSTFAPFTANSSASWKELSPISTVFSESSPTHQRGEEARPISASERHRLKQKVPRER